MNAVIIALFLIVLSFMGKRISETSNQLPQCNTLPIQSTRHHGPTTPANTDAIRSCRNHKYHLSYQHNGDLKVLIVVNYHYPSYNNTVFFDEEYFPLFCQKFKYDYDVLFVGPSRNEEHEILGNGVYTRGRQSYHSVRVAWDYLGVSTIDSYLGMVFMNDDSYVDPTNLNDITPSVSYHETPFTYRGNHWGPWDRHFPESNGTIKEDAIRAFEEINGDRSVNSLCGEWRWTENGHGWSDFFYVTRDQIPVFLQLESILFKYKVYLEIAVYNVMMCLSNHSIRNCNHVGCLLNYYEYTHIHPVKYSSMKNRLLSLSLMKRNISRYDRWLFQNGHYVVEQGFCVCCKLSLCGSECITRRSLKTRRAQSSVYSSKHYRTRLI